VSHRKLRSEKICLNCGTETTGRYCPSCGQENIEPKQSVWHLITHFFSDLTHFDGKFFLTVKDLFAKPGFLSREYMMGRRMSYLDPIRMYIFTSAFFFLIFFSVFNVKNMHIGDATRKEMQQDSSLNELITGVKKVQDSLKNLNDLRAGKVPLVRIDENDSSLNHLNVNFDVERSEYPTIAAYDSAQHVLPVSKRHNWLKRRITIKKIELNQRYKNDRGALFRELASNYIHNCPKILFISLPIFALLLKLLYIRRRQFYYVDHGIFSVHLYIFSFLILLILFGIGGLKTYTGWSWLNWLTGLTIIYPFFYFYKAMRKFYGQRRAKTIFKYILLLFLSLFVQLAIFIGAVVFTVFET
jgi:Protein of unknown function (DUF3667)